VRFLAICIDQIGDLVAAGNQAASGQQRQISRGQRQHLRVNVGGHQSGDALPVNQPDGGDQLT
jgi:hypothetical protein